MAITTVNLSDTFRVFVQKVNTLSTNLGDIQTIFSDSDVVKTLNALKVITDNLDSDIGLPTSNLTTTNASNIINAINELDSDIGALANLTTLVKSSIVDAINELDSDVGNISTMTVDDKSSIVAAVNDLDRRLIDVFDSDGTLLNV
jgi:hypothetical protein